MLPRLIFRSILGTLTPSERAELDAWIAADPANARLYAELTDRDRLTRDYRRRRAINTRRPADDIRRRIRAYNAPRRRRVMAVAASIVLLLGLGVTAILSAPGLLNPAAHDDTQLAILSIDSIRPGRALASLTTADGAGDTIRLDARSIGLPVGTHPTAYGGAASSRPQGSPVGMHPGASAPASHIASPVEQLCLDVPRGGEFKIVLSDSTEVWLNSESRLCFPEQFTGNERRVSITGEAYFAVRKDPSRPFIVETNGQLVQVHGTTFNIRHYPGDVAVLTTLESGSISLSRADGIGGSVRLTPGHQSRFSTFDSKVHLTTVDPEIVTSWRKGRFVFENQTLYEIMKDLSRWYNFTFTFADPALRDEQFMGSIPRYSDFKTAISILEKCGGITFTLTPEGSILITRP